MLISRPTGIEITPIERLREINNKMARPNLFGHNDIKVNKKLKQQKTSIFLICVSLFILYFHFELISTATFTTVYCLHPLSHHDRGYDISTNHERAQRIQHITSNNNLTQPVESSSSKFKRTWNIGSTIVGKEYPPGRDYPFGRVYPLKENDFAFDGGSIGSDLLIRTPIGRHHIPGIKIKRSSQQLYQHQQPPAHYISDLPDLMESVSQPKAQLAYHQGVVSNGLYERFPVASSILVNDDYDLLDSYKRKFDQYNSRGNTNLDDMNELLDSDRCGTLLTSVHLEKDELDKATGQLVRTCRGTFQLAKCEGTCMSISRPSIKTPSGFFKACSCCRESIMRKSVIQLVECFDDQGVKIELGPKGNMAITVDEPVDCRCHECSSSAN